MLKLLHILAQGPVCIVANFVGKPWKDEWHSCHKLLGNSSALRNPPLSETTGPSEVYPEDKEDVVVGPCWGKQMDEILPICGMKEDPTARHFCRW